MSRAAVRYYPGVECVHGYDACPMCDRSEGDDSRETARAVTLDLLKTADEPKNPPFTAPDSIWAGCPFAGDEAFNVSSAVGLIRKLAADKNVKAAALAARGKIAESENERSGAIELQTMADKLSVSARKIRARCAVEAQMGEAQRINAGAPV